MSRSGEQPSAGGRNPLRRLGAAAIAALQRLGDVGIFVVRLILSGLTPPFDLRLLWRQIVEAGFLSLPVVGLTAAFAGAVLALQSHVGMARFNAGGALPQIVVLSLCRELAPVLSGLLVAGRVGAAIAAEIATMRVSEQIDALLTLRTDPFRHLLAPRLYALALTLPVLVLVADLIGVLGALAVATLQLDLQGTTFLLNAWRVLETVDITLGLVKALVFALIIAAVSCLIGYHVRGGAREVGIATTRAVVFSSILILVANYLVTHALM